MSASAFPPRHPLLAGLDPAPRMSAPEVSSLIEIVGYDAVKAWADDLPPGWQRKAAMGALERQRASREISDLAAIFLDDSIRFMLPPKTARNPLGTVELDERAARYRRSKP